MKKLLIIFSIFTITLPAMAALNKRALCELAVDTSNITEWPKKYQDMITTTLSEPLNIEYKLESTGSECNADCKVGQKLEDCVTPDECIKTVAGKIIQYSHEDRFKKELCGHILESAEPTDADTRATSIAYWQKDKEKNQSSAKTTTVSGTVLDENDEPLISATVAIPGIDTGTITDNNGKFELENVPNDAELEVSFLGYKKQTITPETNHKITMEVDSTILEGVTITACPVNKKNGIKEQQKIDGKCYPTSCVEPRWTLSGTDKDAKCVEQKCEFKNGTGEWIADGDTWKCNLKDCNTAKGWKKNDLGDACIEILDECTDKQKAEHPNATKTGIKKDTETCIAQECKCGFKLENGACVQWSKNEQCTKDTKPSLPANAKNGLLKCDGEKAYCEVGDCNDDHKRSDDKKSCKSVRGDDCDATAVDKNATAGTNKNVKGKMTCVITDCAHGFAPNKDGTKCVAGELSEEDSQAKIDELRNNADAIKANEQSFANKSLGAAGIGATGIGGMQMASAMAEEKADADAEQAMRTYLATFHCNYGAGKNIAGGERDVELPGGNELIGLYSEYVNLANDLKIRKTALDMRPGIESESILDAATSGLYDDIAIGKTSGAYTSLARALMDPNGADAAAWAEQKADTADKKKTGMITAGIGAAGSLVGNMSTNSGKDKQNKVNENPKQIR